MRSRTPATSERHRAPGRPPVCPSMHRPPWVAAVRRGGGGGVVGERRPGTGWRRARPPARASTNPTFYRPDALPVVNCWFGDRGRYPACKKLGVGWLVVITWLEFCMSYSWGGIFNHLLIANLLLRLLVEEFCKLVSSGKVIGKSVLFFDSWGAVQTQMHTMHRATVPSAFTISNIYYVVLTGIQITQEYLTTIS